jgi:hypothetical protein
MVTASAVANRYHGRRAVLATRHGKEHAVTEPLWATLGLSVEVADVDTDALGTFTGEIERPGTMLETAIAKARLGMRHAGADLGLASEGSYGPHPFAPFLPSGTELLVLVDDAAGITMHETQLCEQTNFDHATTRDVAALEPFLRRVGFPEHGLVVQPNAPPRRLRLPFAGRESAAAVSKGIRTPGQLKAAIARAARLSQDGLARVTTDMRAFMNPTRMAMIARLAQRLADRVATPCPACTAPGFGPIEPKRGLPCAQCGTPTELVTAEVSGCIACEHRLESPRRDGATTAEPTYCNWCNP